MRNWSVELPGLLHHLIRFGCVVLTMTHAAQADTVISLSKDGQPQTYSGEITNLVGEIITIRTAQSEISLGLSRVVRFSHRKPSSALAAISCQENRKYREAIRFFDQAINQAASEWSKRELQAAAAASCVAAGEFQEAVTRIETILQSDPRSRHVQLLPLVWEERLSANQKFMGNPEQLQTGSDTTQLVNASALLLDPQHGNNARITLNRLRRDAEHTMIARLAECQLWRLYLLEPLRQRDLPDYWITTAHQLPSGLKGGPWYILGRLQAERHLHEDATVSYLWLPLMDHFDPHLTAVAMDAAAASLKTSGRTRESERVARERKQRFATVGQLSDSSQPD